MRETVKCAWDHCKQESRQIRRDEAICENGKYYHPECFSLKTKIAEMRKSYANLSEKEFSIPMLNKVLNTLIIKQNIDPDYLLFAIKYDGTSRPFRSPLRLYTIAKDSSLQRTYERRNGFAKMDISKGNKNEDPISLPQVSFKYVPEKTGFGTILGGKDGL